MLVTHSRNKYVIDFLLSAVNVDTWASSVIPDAPTGGLFNEEHIHSLENFVYGSCVFYWLLKFIVQAFLCAFTCRSSITVSDKIVNKCALLVKPAYNLYKNQNETLRKT